MNLINEIVKVGEAATKTVIKNGPDIMVKTGTVGMVAGTVMACAGTVKAQKKLEARKQMLDDIQEAWELAKEGKVAYTEQEMKADIATANLKCAWDIAGCYAAAGGMIIGSVALIWGGLGIIKIREANATSAALYYAGAFEELRKNIRNKYGEQEEWNLLHNAHQETYIDEDGNEKTVTVVEATNEELAKCTMARFFDETSREYVEGQNDYMVQMLLLRQSAWNDVLQREGKVMFNDIAADIDVAPTNLPNKGWIKQKPGEPIKYISFGIDDGRSEGVRRFVNGLEDTLFMQFNCDEDPIDLEEWDRQRRSEKPRRKHSFRTIDF